jgi:hypothetical protein
LWRDKDLQEIRRLSGPLANGCEYQVHYWALTFRIKTEDSILDICIPTTFFNYKQDVTGAHIDFELTDVESQSDALAPVHTMQVQKLINELKVNESIRKIIPEEFEMNLISTSLNSIHKHPGGSMHQAFSGMDLNTSHTYNTGIVFPLAEAKEQSNFAGIMAHDGSDNRIARFEYRIANGEVTQADDSEIVYKKGRCMCYVKGVEQSSKIEKMIGIKDKDISYSKYYEIPTTIENCEIFNAIRNLWDNLDFEPFTQFVIPSNVANKVVSNPYNYKNYQKVTNTNNKQGVTKSKNGKSTANQLKVWGLDDDDFDDDIYDQYENGNWASIGWKNQYEDEMSEDDISEEEEILLEAIEKGTYIKKCLTFEFETGFSLGNKTFKTVAEKTMDISNHYYYSDEKDKFEGINDFTSKSMQELVDEYLKIYKLIRDEIKNFCKTYNVIEDQITEKHCDIIIEDLKNIFNKLQESEKEEDNEQQHKQPSNEKKEEETKKVVETLKNEVENPMSTASLQKYKPVPSQGPFRDGLISELRAVGMSEDVLLDATIEMLKIWHQNRVGYKEINVSK